ncbi:MAG: very short patch repair endonuclease [Planctomycetota bacterium]|nr:MAG: very short patch repair endonuclease [Planctomycetota bacterium]
MQSRLHVASLPGKPDIVFPRLRAIINVHGCFWHLRRCRHGLRAPVSNAAYWQAKRDRNVARDRRNLRRLRRLGWRVLTIWECQTRNAAKLKRKISRFLANL